METLRKRWKTCINLIKKRQKIAVFIRELIHVMWNCSCSQSNNSIILRAVYHCYIQKNDSNTAAHLYLIIFLLFLIYIQRCLKDGGKVDASFFCFKFKQWKDHAILPYIKDSSCIFCDNIAKSYQNRYWHWCKRLLEWKSNKGLSLFGRHHHQETNILGEVQLEEFLFVYEKIFMIKLRKKGWT